MILQKLLSYLSFKKQPEFNKETQNNDNMNGTDNISDETSFKNMSYLKMMHGINRISIIMFLIGMVIVVMKIIK